MLSPRYARWLVLALLPLGCLSMRRQIDQEVAAIGLQADSVKPTRVVDATLPTSPKSEKQTIKAVASTIEPRPPAAALDRPRRTPLSVPADLPGADAPPLRVPGDTPEAKKKALAEIYPEIAPLPPERPLAPGPEGHPLTLADLQRLGETYSPALKNAQAAIEAAKGAAKQAGAYPNPNFIFEQDTVQTFQGGYQGGGVDQIIKTGGKLKLAQAAAMMDVLNAKLAMKRARSDLHYQIRTAYFGVLVARENIRVSDALFRFTHDIYRIQLDLLGGGFVAAYEPMQLRPLVMQAQLSVITARNQYAASWKQLVAAMGLPDMPPAEVDGRIDLPVPSFDYNQVLGHLSEHTDVATAFNSIQKAKYQLQLAKVIPLPDVDVHVLVQKDYTTPPFSLTHSLSVTVPVPIWDQNRGGIYQAESQLAQASVGPDSARNALINTLADAFNRYETARKSVEISQQQVRDQVRAYRGVYERRQNQNNADVQFNDLVTAEQSLVTYVSGYITALGQQWQAVADVANLLQTDDLFDAGTPQTVTPVPHLDELLAPWGAPHAGQRLHHKPHLVPLHECSPCTGVAVGAVGMLLPVSHVKAAPQKSAAPKAQPPPARVIAVSKPVPAPTVGPRPLPPLLDVNAVTVPKKPNSESWHED